MQLEQVKDDIILLRPAYGPEGDSTELWTREGVIVDRRSIRSVKKALARLYAIDLPAQGEQVARIIDRQTVLPFYLPPDRVFIPFKMRKPICANDRCCGYADVNFVDTIGHKDGHTQLVLKDGRTLDLFCTSATAAQTICLGQKLSSALQAQPGQNEEEVITQAVLLLLKKLQQLDLVINKFMNA
ncbi:MAG TPA: hypothetical protein PLG09_05345 [Syntrophomonadaceae bacterium]|nr:hypothetical protein [Syntrophomonadaceae bacterium]HPU48023.1 hypothetical protein [Syntrophomonadaceae bacterium]